MLNAIQHEKTGTARSRIADIIKRAEKSGTEIWFGDIKTTQEEVVREMKNPRQNITFPVRLLSSLWLGRKGDAQKRLVSRKIVTALEHKIPSAFQRELTMADKVRFLASKSGHRRIGLFVGAGHAGIADILEKGISSNKEHRKKLAERGEDALKMYRCIYNEEQGRWRAEEHSL